MAESVGQRIRTLRKARGLTQRALAEQAGLYHTTVSELERGVTIPGLDTLNKIAAVLEVSPGGLLPAIEPTEN